MITHLRGFLKRMVGAQAEILSGPDLDARNFIARIKSKKLTYLSNKKLTSIADTCRSIEKANLNGSFIEAGCALGGSAILMASLKTPDRKLFVYDVFGMIPPPSNEDPKDVHDRYDTIVKGQSKGIRGDKYYGYEENLYEVVQSNFKSFGIDVEEQSVYLIKGLLQDTMKIDQPVAFAHVDVDWYDPVMTCLNRIFPNLVVGGSIILDDYHDWGGCKKAADEYLQGIFDKVAVDDSNDSMKITKVMS